MLGRKKQMAESFEIITVRLSGMRFTDDYEIILRGDEAEVSKYGIRYTQAGNERVPERRAFVGKNEILKLINECGLLSWDGFSGAHPFGVKDGVMFSLKAVVNGKSIRASGSENFPKHYREFMNAIYEMLRQGEEL
jgi:hypothetical protein